MQGLAISAVPPAPYPAPRRLAWLAYLGLAVDDSDGKNEK